MKSVCVAALALLLVSISFPGCTQSLIYSPFVNLPPRPLVKKQTHIQAGVGYYPETRPHKAPDKTAAGGEASFRVAICDHFTLQGKAWKDLSDYNADRWGASMSNIAMLNGPSDFRLGLMPTAAFAFGLGELQGGGGALRLCLWFTRYDPLDFYASLGPAFGIRGDGSSNRKWGWGVLGNVGAAVLVKDHLSINLELSGIKQVNEYEDKNNYFVCPSVSIGYVSERR